MNRLLPFVSFSLLVLAQACTSPTPEVPAAVSNSDISNTMTTSPGLIHQVYFWLTPGLDETAREEFVAGMRSLGAAPTVQQVVVGGPAATPSRGVVDNSFDYMLVLHFEDVAAHDAYQVSPTHLAFVAAHEAKFKEVRVFDGAVIK